MRRPGSVRRTTSIDSDWPEGQGKPWEMTGRARDLLTPADGGEAVVIGAAQYRIIASPGREILSISATPDHPGLQTLVGARAGGASRRVLDEALGDRRGTPLFQLLDDYAGASLVAGWIWSRWTDDWLRYADRRDAKITSGKGGQMMNICTGFAEGASSLHHDGQPDTVNQSSADVGPLENPEDAMGWHAMPVQEGPQKRRANGHSRISCLCRSRSGHQPA